MKKLLFALICSGLMASAPVFCDTPEEVTSMPVVTDTAPAITPAPVTPEVAPTAPEVAPVITPAAPAKDTTRLLAAQLKEAAKNGDLTKLQEILKDAQKEQKILKNSASCKDVTKTIIYKALCNAVKGGRIDFIKELLAKESILNAFNTKVSATKFDAVKADRLEKLIVKHNRLDFAEFLIEKTEYRVRLAGLLATNDAQLKISQDMQNLLAKHAPGTTVQV